MKAMNEYVKVGLIGTLINIAINWAMYVAKGITLAEYFPSYIVWMVFIGIGCSQWLTGKDFVDMKDKNVS